MPESRFKVVTVTGWPITPEAEPGGKSREGLTATVLDTFYGSEHGSFRSEDRSRHDKPSLRAGDPRYGRICPACGGTKHRNAHACRRCQSSGAQGAEAALAAAMARCAELNEWDEREAARSVA